MGCLPSNTLLLFEEALFSVVCSPFLAGKCGMGAACHKTRFSPLPYCGISPGAAAVDTAYRPCGADILAGCYIRLSKISRLGLGITTLLTCMPNSAAGAEPHFTASLTAATSPVSTTKDLPPMPVPSRTSISDT